MFTLSGLRFTVGVSLLFLCRVSLYSQSTDTVVYGGFAFAGNAGNVAANYPFSSAVEKGGVVGASLFENQLGRFIRERVDAIPGVKITFDIIGKDQTAYVMALALTDEKILRETMGEVHKLVIQLGFELLTLDFREMQVVSSVPICIELIDAKSSEFTELDINNRLLGMIDGDESQLFTILAERLNQIKIKSKNVCTLQVSSVLVGGKAIPYLPPELQKRTEAYGQYVAQQFGSILGAKAGVAMLPFAKDGLNSKMSLRFSDASTMQFLIPPPSFAVSVEIQGFKKILKEKTPAESLWIYGAFLGFRIYEPEFQRTYMQSSTKFAVPKIVPASQLTVDEFPVVSEALKGAFLNSVELILKNKDTRVQVIQKCQL